jgi:hypothetical protein
MMIDLVHCIPEKLAETVAINDLTETVLSMESWNDRKAHVLDFIYRQLLDRLLRVAKRGEDSARGLRGFAEHLDRATHPVRLKKLEHLSKPYGARWTAYLDIMNGCLASLESDVPDRAMGLKNVPEILAFILEHGTVERKKIQVKFNLKDGNLTRILNTMESSDLIISETVGREKRYSGGSNSIVSRMKSEKMNPGGN